MWLLTTVTLPLLLSIGLVVPAAARGLPVKLYAVSLDRSELSRALPFVGSLAVIALSSLLFDSTDSLVISAMPELGVAQIAAYDIGTRFQKLVRPFVEAFVVALSPGLVALASRRGMRALQGNVTTHVRQMLLLASIPTVGLAGVSEPFVAHWVGETFVARSVPVMWVALASALLWGPGPYAFRVLVAVSRLRFVTIGALRRRTPEPRAQRLLRQGPRPRPSGRRRRHSHRRRRLERHRARSRGLLGDRPQPPHLPAGSLAPPDARPSRHGSVRLRARAVWIAAVAARDARLSSGSP